MDSNTNVPPPNAPVLPQAPPVDPNAAQHPAAYPPQPAYGSPYPNQPPNMQNSQQYPQYGMPAPSTASQPYPSPPVNPSAQPATSPAPSHGSFSSFFAQPQAASHGAQPSPSNEPDVKRVETMGNGTVVKHYHDGRKATCHPDGRVESIWPDGSTETMYPDGTKHHYAPTVPKEDYVDKAFAFGAKKLGFRISREHAEKITDKGRGMFEKATGMKLSSKISN